MASEKIIPRDGVKFTEIFFNIDDVSFSVHYMHSTRRMDASEWTEEFYPKSEREVIRSLKLHKHMYCEMFLKPLSPFPVIFDGGELTMEYGDILLISEGTMHTVDYRTSPKVTAICFSFTKNRLYRHVGLYDQMTKLMTAPYLHIKNMKRTYGSVDLFFDSLDAGEMISSSRYFFDIISDVITSTVDLPRVAEEDMLPDTDIRRNRRILRLIEKHYKDSVSLEVIAEELNLSVRQTSRIIRATTGHTLGELILEKRMADARVLLENGSLTVSEISTRVGYNSLTSFYGAFKKYYGVLPKEYRKKYQTKRGKSK